MSKTSLDYTCVDHDSKNCADPKCLMREFYPLVKQATARLKKLKGIHKEWMSTATERPRRAVLTRETKALYR